MVCAEISTSSLFFHDVLLAIGSIGPFTCDRQTPVYSFARTRARRDLSPASSSVGPPSRTKALSMSAAKKANNKSAATTTYAIRDTVLGKVRGYQPWPGMVRSNHSRVRVRYS